MTAIVFDGDQEDALREIVNVAMGRAADALARLLDVFVQLPVPQVRLLRAGEILEGVRAMINGLDRVTCVRQAFGSGLTGESLVLFDPLGLDGVAGLLGREGEVTTSMDEGRLLELSNLLVGACLGATARELGCELVFAPPSVLLHNGTLEAIVDTASLPWRHALLVEVNFGLEGHRFACHIVSFFPEESLVRVREGVDRFLEALG